MAARMREYVAHRQMLPLIALLISASLGAGLFSSSAAADMIWPDWQYPHCGTCSSIHAACSALPAGLCNPSIVVTFRPATDASVVTHERTGWPSRCTVQAPHIAMPHPNFVPVQARPLANCPEKRHVGLRIEDSGLVIEQKCRRHRGLRGITPRILTQRASGPRFAEKRPVTEDAGARFHLTGSGVMQSDMPAMWRCPAGLGSQAPWTRSCLPPR